MSTVNLNITQKKLEGEIHLTSSKSESNRALIIRAVSGLQFKINKLSTSTDTQTLHSILEAEKKNKTTVVDAGNAGTTFRFLTAYFASQEGTVTLTGSERMKQRPIGLLVEALRRLGAEIHYTEKKGYPPLKITGKKLRGGVIEMDGSVSSQYISALAMITPRFENDLHIKFTGEVISKPYITMTLKMMQQFGAEYRWSADELHIKRKDYILKKDFEYTVEADWSAASYWFSLAALADVVDLKLFGLNEKSLQGDSVTAQLFSFFDIKTEYIPNGIRLTRTNNGIRQVGFDFCDCPDIAQTVAVTACALNIPFVLSGLKSLRIKETDRIQALINELKKLNCKAEEISEGILRLTPGKLPESTISIKTYDDHRMAMAFTAMVMITNILIEDPDVVKKSYPEFWNDLKKVGISISEN